MVGGNLREFVYNTDGPAFLEESWWDLVYISTGRAELTIVQVDQYPFIYFKSITFCALELVHQIKGFIVRKDGIGVSQVGFRAHE